MIRFIFSAVFMILGLIICTIAVIGNFKYSHVLNRMQVAAIADTLGATFIIVSLIIANGLDILGLKLVLVLAFMWFVNPVSSHFLAKAEIITDEKITEKCEVKKNDSI